MANWSQSHFLQSIGWAILNSFWQMALLWCFYILVSYLFNLRSHKKYTLATLSISAGFIWAIVTFLFYYQNNSPAAIEILNVSASKNFLNIFLLSASVAYLGLLIFPSYKLFKNWQFVQCIKKEGLQKANPGYRLFVQKIGNQLGIRKKILVYVSEIVKSPVTIGYLKPIILLPLAALNNLSVQQAEAVLLHEIAHIKRYDYLINLIISLISTLLYFNPFVKKFLNIIEEERESCCDELVLQFGYDKISYAAALLTLEKISVQRQPLALAATGKKYLLNRIEKIVGMEKKKSFKLKQFAVVLITLLGLVAFNSVLLIQEEKQAPDKGVAYQSVANPFALFTEAESRVQPYTVNHVENLTAIAGSISFKKAEKKKSATYTVKYITVKLPPAIKAASTDFINVAFDEANPSLSNEQEAQIKSTVEATKKIVSSLQWKTIENEIGDAMTKKEKAVAHQDYLQEVDKINWQNVEQNMKVHFDNLNWNKINTLVTNTLTDITLDSLETVYSTILTALKRTDSDLKKAKISSTPMPDASVAEIKKATKEMKAKVDTIKALRTKKIVRL